MHIFQLSRFIIDAERLEHDPSEAKGQGIIYTDFGGFHREISPRNVGIPLSELIPAPVRNTICRRIMIN